MQQYANSHQILIVEDAVDLAEGIAMNLRYEGFRVDCAHTGGAALRAAKAALPDLLLLDILLPDMGGLAVLEAMRNIGFEGAVIILSGLTSEWDQHLAFKLGASQYVTKPFDLNDLIEKVRHGISDHASTDAIVAIDRATHTVRLRGQQVTLTPKEFDLLATIVEANGSVVTRSDLLRKIWGITGAYRTTTLDSHIKQLRMKLQPFGLKHAIMNVPKIGFRWAP